MTDYYSELGLDRNLSVCEIRDKLIELEIQIMYHEDVNPIKSQKKLELINEAKKIFTSPETRKEYDSQLNLKTQRQKKAIDIPITTASLVDRSKSGPEAIEKRAQKIKKRRRCKRLNRYRMSYFWRGASKSYFSVICVGLAVASVVFWAIAFTAGFGNEGAGIMHFLAKHEWSVVGISFGAFFLIAGFPWGWILFWPFWRDFVTRFRFFFFSIIRWPLLLVCCLCFGWINMLIHTPTIIKDFRGA